MSRPRLKKDPPIAWHFQLNPDYFRSPEEADLYVIQCVDKDAAWYVGQNAEKMEVGQQVYVWRSAGKRREGAGVIARGVIKAKPTSRTSFDWEKPFEKRSSGKDPRAVLRLDEAFTDSDNYLPKARLQNHWFLSELKIIRCPQGSNFGLTKKERDHLEALLAERRPAPRLEIPRSIAKLARISYNSSGWKCPTNEAGKLEDADTFNALHGFGYEDWLFRGGWQLGGWRYAFIQAFNHDWPSLRGRVFDLSLFTIDGQGQRLAVGRIREIEVLTLQEMAVAVNSFRKHGWLDIMRAEIAKVGGKPAALEYTDWAPYFLNVRFRTEHARLVAPGTLMPNTQWMANRGRYNLYDYDPGNTVFDLWAFRGRRAGELKDGKNRRKRGASGETEVDPIHDRMQAKLAKKLRRRFPRAKIESEKDWVDLKVETGNAIILYEIKTDVRAFMAIRRALGQLLEYAFHPHRHHGLPVMMVIVGRSDPTTADLQYLKVIQKKFSITYDSSNELCAYGPSRR